MNIGPYAVSLEGIPSILINTWDASRVHLRGIPALPGDNPVEIAKEVLKRNARDVLYAGAGHFWFMWPSDFGKAVRGALKTLPPAYLRAQIDSMIRESKRLGRVPTCFTSFGRFHGFDMPYYRADNLPWLLHAAVEYSRWTADGSLWDEFRPALQGLIDGYERELFSDGLIAESMRGDWMDTIVRPSSTYNNLCALKMLRQARQAGLRTATDPDAFASRLLESRWREDHLTDFAGTEHAGVDAMAVALYHELFDRRLREAMAGWFDGPGRRLLEPYPVKVATRDYDLSLLPPLARFTPKYHSSIWLHMGFMLLNGFKRLGRDVSPAKARVDALIMRHRNVIEAVGEDGLPYRTLFHATEYGLSMAAGQYLELALD